LPIKGGESFFFFFSTTTTTFNMYLYKCVSLFPSSFYHFSFVHACHTASLVYPFKIFWDLFRKIMFIAPPGAD
jgi:hypothetical protein